MKTVVRFGLTQNSLKLTSQVKSLGLFCAASMSSVLFNSGSFTSNHTTSNATPNEPPCFACHNHTSKPCLVFIYNIMFPIYY